MINPLDIEKKEFKISMRGYDKAEVNTFMSEIGNTLEHTMQELKEITKERDELKHEVDKYKQMEETLSETLLVAKTASSEILESAKRKEEIIIREAELKVEEKIRKGEVESIKLQNKIDKLRLKHESEKIRLSNFLKAQLALLEDEIPTIDSIKDNSSINQANKPRAEVILDNNDQIIKNDALMSNIQKEDMDDDNDTMIIIGKEIENNINSDIEEEIEELPSLENINQGL